MARDKDGSGVPVFRIFLAIAGLVYMVSSRGKSSTSPSGGPPPATPVAQSTPPPAKLAPLKFDWPRGGPAEGKAELADDLATRNFYIVLDGSGSMGESRCAGKSTKMAVAKEALAEFAKSLPASAQLGMMAFDGAGPSERVPLGRGNRAEFMRAVNVVTAGGGTPLKSAITLGIEKLEAAARRQLGYGEYNLVIVTDGEAGPGEDPRAVVDDVLARTPVTIHTIGFCMGKDHSLNQPGRTIYKTADNPAELRAGLGDVLAEAQSFDVSGYSPAKGGVPHH